MKIKPKPRPLHTLNSSHKNIWIILYQGPKSKLQHTRKTLGILSWVFKEDDYSIVIRYGSPCSGSVSSLLKPTRHYRRMQTEQVVLKSKDSRSKPPLVSNFYMRLNDFKTAIGDELLHQCEQYKPTQQVKAEHQCVK